jgi:NAD(P)-dependent dehydrogenase (short-subunit alcohol dehydrogenase family)
MCRGTTISIHIVDAALNRSSHLDVLINNAGIHINQPFLKTTRDGRNRVLAVNLVAPFRLIQLVAPVMAHTGRGANVNMSSIDAYGTDGNFASYNASMAAVLALTRQAATELASCGIRVNSVDPGWTEPSMAAAAVNADDLANMKNQFERVPIQRLITRDEVTSAIAFLVSDAASGITGVGSG